MCPRPIGSVRHMLKTNALVKPLGLLRCTHRPSANQGECGARVLVFAMEGGWHYVAELFPSEIRVVEQLSGEDILAYLLSGNGLLAIKEAR